MKQSMNVLLTLEYDGTNYNGWQSQNNARAIQDIVDGALAELHGGSSTPCIGCSRTDAGVHALGYKCNFHTGLSIPADRFPFALNPLLPDDIKVINSEEVPEDFHARYNAKSKTYIYKFYYRQVESPLLRTRAWNVKSEPDIELMKKAAVLLTGTHDFSSFMAAGGYPSTTVRTIFNSEIEGPNEGIFTFKVRGDGFLYNMVRIMAGTIFYAGTGKISPDDIPEIISAKDRKKAGITAPAHGLYLFDVEY